MTLFLNMLAGGKFDGPTKFFRGQYSLRMAEGVVGCVTAQRVGDRRT